MLRTGLPVSPAIPLSRITRFRHLRQRLREIRNKGDEWRFDRGAPGNHHEVRSHSLHRGGNPVAQ